uniref:Uncharacterized protein n=1 Tax=Panagrolaimus sp. ES5 TaxID=591445 RepID=A0AC34F5I1_9BILA
MSTEKESELVLNTAYYMHEGCFHYYRDYNFRPLVGFRNFIQRLVYLSLSEKSSNKLFLLENENPEDPSTLVVNFTQLLSSNNLDDIISTTEFATGWTSFVIAESLTSEEAKKIWLRLVQCKLENESPDSELFGNAETFSITGDANILVWTNPTLQQDSIKCAAYDVDYCIQEEDIDAYKAFKNK